MGFFQFLFLGRADESIGTDFDKPFGQDMTQKAADEFLGWQGEMFEFLGFVVAVSESDLPVLKLLQSAVADRNPKGIASEVFEHFLAAPGVLDLHVPSWPRRSA